MARLAKRKKLYTLIDSIPEQSLSAITPLLSFLTNEYWKSVLSELPPAGVQREDNP